MMHAPSTPTDRAAGVLRVFTKRVQQKLSRPRVYFDARWLEAAGFAPGTGISVSIHAGEVHLRATSSPFEGTHHVGHRVRNTAAGDPVVIPVIDIAPARMTEAFQIDESVQITVRHGEIVIAAVKTAAKRAARCRNGLEGSLFSGGGLLSEAARLAGFRPRFAVELDARYADVYERNHPEATVFQCSVTELPLAHLPQVELLTIGLPCEPYSTARSTRNGLAIDRSAPPEAHPNAALLFAIPLVLEAINPATVIVEEAPGFTGTAAWHLLLRWFTLLGYHVESRVLDPYDHGAMTARKRTVIVATSDAGPVTWPLPLPAGSPRLAAQDILEPADAPDCNWFDFAAGERTHFQQHWSRAAAKGHGRIAQMVHAGTTRVGVITKRYFGFRADNPVVVDPAHVERLDRSPTRRDLPGNATRFRLFTLTELKRLAQLREDYDLGENRIVASEVIGQGVIVGFFAALIAAVTEKDRTTQIGDNSRVVPAPQMMLALSAAG